MVIVTHIWQNPSHIEREMTLIVTHFWQLFSRIFGQTSLIVTNTVDPQLGFRSSVDVPAVAEGVW
jgi:hypothetical protein